MDRGKTPAGRNAPFVGPRKAVVAPVENKSLLERVGGEVTVVVLAPFLGSLIALVFEAGYLKHFGVPASLIQLDLVSILKPTASVIAAGLAFLYLMASVADWLASRDVFVRVLGHVASLCLPLGVMVFAAAPSLDTLGVIAGFAALFFLLQVVPPIFEFGTGLPYKDRLARSVEEERRAADAAAESKPTASNAIMDRVLVPAFLICVFCIVLFARGIGTAEDQTDYFVLDDQPDTVLVAQYGELMIFKRANLVRKELTDQMELRKFGEGVAQVKLSLKSVGPLKSVATQKKEAEKKKT